MCDSTKYSRSKWKSRRALLASVTGLLVAGSVTLVPPAIAGASGSTNTFTFAGSYSGTLKLRRRPFASSARPTAGVDTHSTSRT